MARRFVRGIRNTRPRRETQWISMSPAIDTAAGGVAVLVRSGNAALLALRPFTIVRTHITYEFGSDQSIAPEIAIGALGMAVVSDQATAIGVTALPTPITDLGSDLFFVHESLLFTINFKTAVGFQPNSSIVGRIDSKAMRKVNGDQDVVMTYEVSGIAQGGTITTLGRLLIKLH